MDIQPNMFWCLTLILLAIFIGLIYSPYEEDEELEDDEINKDWKIVSVFAFFTYFGVVFSIVAYFIVVLLYHDHSQADHYD